MSAWVICFVASASVLLVVLAVIEYGGWHICIKLIRDGETVVILDYDPNQDAAPDALNKNKEIAG